MITKHQRTQNSHDLSLEFIEIHYSIKIENRIWQTPPCNK